MNRLSLNSTSVRSEVFNGIYMKLMIVSLTALLCQGLCVSDLGRSFNELFFQLITTLCNTTQTQRVFYCARQVINEQGRHYTECTLSSH